MDLYAGIFIAGIITGVILTVWVKGFSFPSRKPTKIQVRPKKRRPKKSFISWG